MKKAVFVILSLLIVMSVLLSACAPAAAPEKEEEGSEVAAAEEKSEAEDSGEEASGEKIVITMEMSSYVEEPHKNVYDQLEAKYEEMNPNIDIEYYGYPYAEFWDKLTTEMVAGNEACIIEMQSGTQHYGTYAALRDDGETGAFVNLDEYIVGSEYEDKMVDQASLKYNGHYIGLSDYAWGSRAIYYRKSLFEEAGIDPASIVTTEDFLDAAIKLTKPAEGDKPAQYGFGAVLSTHPFVWDEMKTFIARPIGATYTPDNLGPYTPENVLVDSPQMKFAWQWWKDMIFEAKVVPPGAYDKADERDLFWNGTVAMNIDGPWFVGMTRSYDEALMDDLGVIPSPFVLYEGEQYPFHGETYAVTHLISTNCEHPEEAWKFMEFLASDESAEVIAECGMIPANKNYSLSDAYKEREPLNAELAAFVNELYKFPAAIDPSIPQQGEMDRIMIEAAQEVFITGADVDATLDAAAEEIRQILAE